MFQVDDYGGFPRYYLVGIISFGTSECGIGYPGVYTRVFYYNDWILKNIKP